jgi:uncharacterized protein YkwD
MKFALILGVLSIFTAIVGMMSNVRAAISPITKSSHMLNEEHENLTAAVSLEQSIHKQVNQYRRAQNLPPLAFDQTIANRARAHSTAMANVGKISHNGFDGRAKEIGQVIAYSSVAENVASNNGYSNPAQVAVKGWIQSPGHQHNMVGNYDLTGIGVIEKDGSYYFTQIFVRKR